jgi:hypothetical protein
MRGDEIDRFAVSRRTVNLALLSGAFGAVAGWRKAPELPAVRRVLFDFAVAGSVHCGSRKALHALTPGERLRLWHHADNPHDPNAVAVLRADGTMLGYVPRRANAPVADLLRRGVTAYAELVSMLDVTSDDGIPGDLVFTGFCDGDPRLRLVAYA